MPAVSRRCAPLLTESLAAAERDVGLHTAWAPSAPQDPACRHPLAYAAHTPIRPPTGCGTVPWRAYGAYGSSSETAYPCRTVRPPPLAGWAHAGSGRSLDETDAPCPKP